MLNVLTSFKNLKTKVGDLDIGKWQAVPVDLKKLSDVVDNEFVKKQNSTHWKQKQMK